MASHPTQETGAINSASSTSTIVNSSDIPRPGGEPPKDLVQEPPLTSPYAGAGTEGDPYVVEWLEGDKENPYNWTKTRKWVITGSVAITTLCIAFASSAYSGGAREMIIHFKISKELYTAGVSLFVLGFGAGPLIWAPLSEMFGRRPVFLISYACFTLFHIGGACAQNIQTVLITRFFAGFFGAAPLTNSGGNIADIWSGAERGIASSLFALAPFLGPVIGPFIGGFASISGWRNMFWVMFAFAGVTYIWSILLVPETYAPALLRTKAKRLQKESGGSTFYVGKFDKLNTKTKAEIFKINMTRPFQLLAKEPIVLFLSIYTAIVYGTLYLFFGAFPIIYQTGRGWNSGVGGLAFLGVGGGMIIATALAPLNNKLYLKAIADSPDGRAPPEARLPFAILGSICLPVGLFWFAWTCQKEVHWIVSILAGAPFGFGMITVFSSVISYLIDVYLLYAASALAANAVLRSILGAVFPLFTNYMYTNLGNNWASTIVAFLSLICVPMPLLFYKYGAKIRAMSKFSPTGKPAPAPAAASATVPSSNDQAPSSDNVLVVEGAHKAQHEVEKVPQPDADSALEPEYGPEAGRKEYLQQQMHEAEDELKRRSEGHKIV